MKTRRLNNFKRGFTLVEMMIAMALLALVAGSLLLFLSAMGNFSKNNSIKVNRIKQQLELRKEIDFWFSAMDAEDCVITLNLGNTLVKATTSDYEYYIRWYNVLDRDEIKESYIQFTYPTPPNSIYGADGPRYVEISADELSSIFFYRQDDPSTVFPESDTDDELVFPITTHVVPANYLCKITYAPQ